MAVVLTKIAIFKPSSIIILPFYLNQHQTFNIKIFGGSEFYEYLSKNTSICSVDSSGQITAKKLGKTVKKNQTFLKYLF